MKLSNSLNTLSIGTSAEGKSWDRRYCCLVIQRSLLFTQTKYLFILHFLAPVICLMEMDRRQRGPTKVSVVGNNWLVGNEIFSETTLRIFLIFCMKLGDYKDRKVTEPDFWKKFLIWGYSRKGLQISPKSDTGIFLKNGFNDFFGFWPEVSTKYYLQFEWNLFFRKIWNLEIFDLEIAKKLPKLRFLVHFLDFALLVFLDFPHNDRWVWRLFVFLQFASPVNVFLFLQRLNALANRNYLKLLILNKFSEAATKRNSRKRLLWML